MRNLLGRDVPTCLHCGGRLFPESYLLIVKGKWRGPGTKVVRYIQEGVLSEAESTRILDYGNCGSGPWREFWIKVWHPSLTFHQRATFFCSDSCAYAFAELKGDELVRSQKTIKENGKGRGLDV